MTQGTRGPTSGRDGDKPSLAPEAKKPARSAPKWEMMAKERLKLALKRFTDDSGKVTELRHFVDTHKHVRANAGR